MKISGHIAIASLLLPLLGADLSSQSSGGRAVQVRATSSRSSVRGVRGFNSRPKSWLLTKPSKKPSSNLTTNPGGGTKQGEEKISRINTRLPKRLFSIGPWLPEPVVPRIGCFAHVYTNSSGQVMTNMVMYGNWPPPPNR